MEIKKYEKNKPVFWQELSINLMEVETMIDKFSKEPDDIDSFSQTQLFEYQKQEKIIQSIQKNLSEMNQIVFLVEQSYMEGKRTGIDYFETTQFDCACHNSQLLSNAISTYHEKKIK